MLPSILYSRKLNTKILFQIIVDSFEFLHPDLKKKNKFATNSWV